MGSPGDGGDQARVTETVLASVRDFLGGPTADGDGWSFDFGGHLGEQLGR